MFYFLNSFTFWIALVALILVVSLRRRVSRLEKELAKLSDSGARQTQGAIVSEQGTVAESYPDELLAYIGDQIQKGGREEEIKASLIHNGWEEEKILGALAHVKGSAQNIDELHTRVEEFKDKASSVQMFIEWVKEDWLMKIGALLLLIGMGWLVSYAFLNNWIGPQGRIVIGLLFGMSMLAWGEWRIRSFRGQGGVLLALGAGVVLMTIFAARHIYDFFTPGIALAIMFATTVFTGLSSVRHRTRSLALITLILGNIAPLLTASGHPDAFGLFSYLFVVAAGTVWVAGITGWRILNAFSLLFFAAYSFIFIVGGVASVEKSTMILFTTLFTALYLTSGIAAMVGGRNQDKRAEKEDLFTAGFNGILLLAWIATLIADNLQSIVTAAWALVFVVIAFSVYHFTQNRKPFFVYGFVSLVMLGAATAFELSGPALTIAYILEASAVVFLVDLLLGDVRAAQRAGWIFILPIMLSSESLSSYAWRDGFFHGDFVVLFLLSLALLVLGTYFFTQRSSERAPSPKGTAIYFAIGGMYAANLLWLTLHSLHTVMTYDTATMITLIIYTVAGLTLYVKGIHAGIKGLYYGGGIVLAFVVFHLLFVDVWNMDLVGKIVTFFVVGMLLLSTALIGRSKKSEN